MRLRRRRRYVPNARTYYLDTARNYGVRLGYRLGLIRYCVHCDGSLVEARERGRRFRADRWLLHWQHERHLPTDGQEQGPMRTDLPRSPCTW